MKEPIEGEGDDRREGARVTINREFATIDEFVAEYATNISATGCFIRSKHPLPVGTKVNLQFTLIASDLEIIEGIGEVVRVVNSPPHNAGMGVKFVRLTERSQRTLDRLVATR